MSTEHRTLIIVCNVFGQILGGREVMEGHEHLGGELHLLLLQLLLAQQRLQTRGFALVTLHSFNWFAF